MRHALRLFFLSSGLALVGPGLLAQKPASLDRKALLASNSVRFTAMVRGDLTALDTLLSPELTYIYSDGALESKAQFLATPPTGRLHYEGIEPL
jgi:uncharacterized protein DUF4440